MRFYFTRQQIHRQRFLFLIFFVVVAFGLTFSFQNCAAKFHTTNPVNILRTQTDSSSSLSEYNCKTQVPGPILSTERTAGQGVIGFNKSYYKTNDCAVIEEKFYISAAVDHDIEIQYALFDPQNSSVVPVTASVQIPKGSLESFPVKVDLSHFPDSSLLAIEATQASASESFDEFRRHLLIRKFSKFDGPVVYQSVVSGRSHSCAVLKNSSVACWGDNSQGQLGNGSRISSSVPVPVLNLNGVVSLSAGAYHTCAIKDEGSLYCWGSNDSGQLGIGKKVSKTTPVQIVVALAFKSVSAGTQHTCGILSDDTVACWGSNALGELAGASENPEELSPMILPGLLSVVQISAGQSFTCALQSDQSVSCWGDGAYGRLGNGKKSSQGLQTVAGLTNVSSIVAGLNQACAISGSDQSVFCWGIIGSAPNGLPLQVPGIKGVKALASSGFKTCAIQSDDMATCWDNSVSVNPVPVLMLPAVKSIAIGVSHACGLLVADGSLSCWGNSNSGQLGNGFSGSFPTPTMALLNSSVKEVVTGNSSTCVLMKDNSVSCFGDNSSSQLGGTAPGKSSDLPVLVSSVSNVKSISSGRSQVCAVLADNSVSCWGISQPDGTVSAPKIIKNLPPVQSKNQSIASGSGHTCALLMDETVSCWGSNSYGQLGNGSKLDSSIPVLVSGLTSVTAVSAGFNHTCALLADQTVRCWGYNFASQLGNLRNVDSAVPVSVTGLFGVLSISAGDNQTCAVLTDHTVSCWGIDLAGYLGPNSASLFSNLNARPAPVVNLGTAQSVSVGGAHACAVLSGGRVSCWGRNSYDLLVDGMAFYPQMSLYNLSTLPEVLSVSASTHHTCAVLADGSLTCWGANNWGQLARLNSNGAFQPSFVF